jgi:hypothetical protein
MKIHYSSALSGAGKTHALKLKAMRLVGDGQNVLIVQPTKELINKTANELKQQSSSVPLHVLHEDTVERSVVGEILAYLKQPLSDPHVLIITWSAFERLPFFNRRDNWHILTDEIPQAHRFEEIRAPVSHNILTNHIDTVMAGSTYSQVIVQNWSRVRKVAENRERDAVINLFVPLARTLDSDHWKTYVHEAHYRALLKGDRSTLQAFSILQSSIFEEFASVTMVRARFKETPLYQLWSAQGIKFDVDRELEDELRYTEHKGGDRVNIFYAFEDDWSKNIRDKDGQRAWKLLLDSVEKTMGHEPFVWSANAEFKDNLFGKDRSEWRLPNVPHGRNDFQDFHNVAFLSALNPPTSHYKFMAYIGINEDALKTAVYGHAVYQAVLRCSIRNPETVHPVRIIVPDRRAAEGLQSYLPGSTMQSLEIDLGYKPLKGKAGRPAKHGDVDRRIAHRQDQKRKFLEELAVLNEISESVPNSPEGNAVLKKPDGNLCDKNPLKDIGKDFVTRFHGTVWEHLGATKAHHCIHGLTEDTFIKLLKGQQRRRLRSKSDNILISPAFFASCEGVETSRGLGNVMLARGAWLDFEDGDLTHQEFADLFPRLRIVVFNTWSSTKADLRWRAYIPTSQAIPAGIYRLITGQILKIVVDAGYRLPKRDESKPGQKAHGIDQTKLNASDLFYMPCQASDLKGSFFKDYKDKLRKPLDAEDWIAHIAPMNAPASSPTAYQVGIEAPLSDEQIAIVEHHRDEWRTHGVLPGSGDQGMWRLALGWNGAGLRGGETLIVRYVRKQLWRTVRMNGSGKLPEL